MVVDWGVVAIDRLHGETREVAIESELSDDDCTDSDACGHTALHPQHNNK